MSPIAIDFHKPMPAAERQTVELAIAHNLVADKESARVAGVSPRAMEARWGRLAWRVKVHHGARREHVIIKLFTDEWISIRHLSITLAGGLMLALSLLIGAGAPTDDLIRIRPGRTTQRTGRRELDDPLDMTELVLADWRANA